MTKRNLEAIEASTGFSRRCPGNKHSMSRQDLMRIANSAAAGKTPLSARGFIHPEDEYPRLSRHGTATPSRREEAIHRQIGQDGILRCGICGQELEESGATIDHIRPRCWSGTNDQVNLQMVHYDCNARKAAAWEGDMEAQIALWAQFSPVGRSRGERMSEKVSYSGYSQMAWNADKLMILKMIRAKKLGRAHEFVNAAAQLADNPGLRRELNGVLLVLDMLRG